MNMKYPKISKSQKDQMLIATRLAADVSSVSMSQDDHGVVCHMIPDDCDPIPRLEIGHLGLHWAISRLKMGTIR